MPAAEWAFWMDDARMNQAPEAARAGFQGARRVGRRDVFLAGELGGRPEKGRAVEGAGCAAACPPARTASTNSPLPATAGSQSSTRVPRPTSLSIRIAPSDCFTNP